MQKAPAGFDELVEKRIASIRSSKPPFTDAEVRETATNVVKMKLAMHLLSDEELFQVENMLLQVNVECHLHRHQLGEFFFPGTWFFELKNTRKQHQVTAYVATKLFKLKGQHARLIWCGPKKDAFRFEKPTTHPVTSR